MPIGDFAAIAAWGDATITSTILPATPDQCYRAARMTAEHSNDAKDCRELLQMLGLTPKESHAQDGQDSNPRPSRSGYSRTGRRAARED